MIRRFNRPDMPVVALARLVVVAQDALAADDKGQPVFKQVQASRHRRGQPPDHDIGECVRGDDDPPPDQFLRFHVVENNNKTARCEAG